jgi:hypothetical protein
MSTRCTKASQQRLANLVGHKLLLCRLVQDNIAADDTPTQHTTTTQHNTMNTTATATFPPHLYFALLSAVREFRVPGCFVDMVQDTGVATFTGRRPQVVSAGKAQFAQVVRRLQREDLAKAQAHAEEVRTTHPHMPHTRQLTLCTECRVRPQDRSTSLFVVRSRCPPAAIRPRWWRRTAGTWPIPMNPTPSLAIW